MKLDKRHLVASVGLLVASIIYNVWVFTRPADGVSTAAVSAPQTEDFGGQPPSSPSTTTAPVDPTQVKPLPDVVLDRLPQWPRNPFASLRPETSAVVETAGPLQPEPIAEPDPVVGTILYSSTRRVAMIDGRVARIGDVVSGVTVIDILPNAVIVESPVRGRRTLNIRPPGGVRTP